MTDALQQVAKDYAKQNPKNEVVFSFASSSTLAKQVEESAPADIFVSASNKWMKYLSEKDLTVKETEKVLVGNDLVLIAPAKSAVNSVDIAKGEWINALKDSYLSVGDPAHVP
ncbi:molybdate ABC transporter substrate-binding protein, partial [Streptococcus pneumoniae]|nr:molybdate ABC transporter substrate-binding protein [Streptococcus pneumoniae]